MEIPLYFTISANLSLVGSIIIAICCLPSFSFRTHHIKVLFYYSATSIILSVAQNSIPYEFKRMWTNPIGNVFVLLEAIFFSWIFISAIKSRAIRRFILISSVLHAMFYVIVFLFYAENSFSYIRFGRDLLMVIFSLSYFYYLLLGLPDENLLKSSMFWISASVIFFFSGTLILSLMRDYLVHVLNNNMAGFWAFRNFFRFLFCLGLTYAVWIDWRNIKSNYRLG